MPEMIFTQKRILIAAPSSGSGKTLVTCGILQALKDMKLSVSAFKTGPDYIDPMFHKKVIGVPSKNLDLFFSDEEMTKTLFIDDNDADISVIEGAMGLYDGIGAVTSDASGYHLASVLKTPVILVVNGKGMGRSVISVIKGFLSDDSKGLIKGVILNQTSKGVYEMLAPVIANELDVKVLGYVPFLKDIKLDSRHLGLKLPEEIYGLKEMVQMVANEIKKTVDFEGLLDIATECDCLKAKHAGLSEYIDDCCKLPVKIGVAFDEVFCFYYEDNLRLLKLLGAELIYFSPVHDSNIPDGISGLIIGGGYPELKAKELSENKRMLQSIKAWENEKVPVLAECGGFMYLHDSIVNEAGEIYKMAGVIKGETFFTGKLVRFGYITLNSLEDNDFLEKGSAIRAHEFHYYDSTDNGDSLNAVKPFSEKSWKAGHVTDSMVAGYPHLYYPSNIKFAISFLDKCRKWEREHHM